MKTGADRTATGVLLYYLLVGGVEVAKEGFVDGGVAVGFHLDITRLYPIPVAKIAGFMAFWQTSRVFFLYAKGVLQFMSFWQSDYVFLATVVFLTGLFLLHIIR